MLSLYDLKALGCERPIGVDGNPYFGWKLKSNRKGVWQTSYRLMVETETGSPVFDSGTVQDSRSVFVACPGVKLASRTVYRWKAEVTDNHGETAIGESAFETGLLDPVNEFGSWAASALPVPERGQGLGKQSPSTLFRKTFVLPEKVQSARLYVTCHGIYRLSVNGVCPDERYLAPEYTDERHYLCYQTYDITALLEKGKNTVGIEVADGWFFGPLTAMRKEALSEPHAVLFRLDATLKDGNAFTTGSDDNVETHFGASVSADLFAGEIFDANRVQRGWDTPDYEPEGWIPAVPAGYDKTCLHAEIGAPVRIVQELPAKKVYCSKHGEWIADFGENTAGFVRIRAELHKGAILRCRHFEMTDKDGNFCDTMYVPDESSVGHGIDQTDVYISDGRETVFEPRFTYHGYRYAHIEGIEDPKPEQFTACVLSTDPVSRGTFLTSDPLINQLYQNTLRSQRANVLSIPTDCPQREKAGWTGDAAIYASTMLQNGDMTNLLSRWLKNLSAEQGTDGSVPIVVPSGLPYQAMRAQGKAYGNNEELGVAGWGDAAVLVPWAMYEITGNDRILIEQYDSMKRWCDFILASAKKPGDETLPPEIDRVLWNTGFQLGEWLIPSSSKDGYTDEMLYDSLKVTRRYTTPLYGWRSIHLLSHIADLLHLYADAAYYRERAEEMKTAIQSAFIQEDGSFPFRHQGAYALMLAFGLVPEEKRTACAKILAEKIRSNDGCLDTGFLATPFLLDALTENGQLKTAYTVLLQTKCPSWLYQVLHGATTVWESWFGLDGNENPLRISFNHYAYGVVDDWMFRTITGLIPEEAGYRRFTVRPRPHPSLQFAERLFESEYGTVGVRWERQDGRFVLRVTVPCNTTAAVILPDGTEREAYSGEHIYTCAICGEESI